MRWSWDIWNSQSPLHTTLEMEDILEPLQTRNPRFREVK